MLGDKGSHCHRATKQENSFELDWCSTLLLFRKPPLSEGFNNSILFCALQKKQEMTVSFQISELVKKLISSHTHLLATHAHIYSSGKGSSPLKLFLLLTCTLQLLNFLYLVFSQQKQKPHLICHNSSSTASHQPSSLYRSTLSRSTNPRRPCPLPPSLGVRTPSSWPSSPLSRLGPQCFCLLLPISSHPGVFIS